MDQAGRVCLRTLIAGCVIAALGALAACTDGDDLPPPAPPPPEVSPASPSPTFDQRTTEAWQEIQEKFDGLMETWIKWAAEGDPGGFEDPVTAELNDYADAFLLGEATAELSQEARDGHVRAGRPAWSGAWLIELDWDFMIQDNVVPNALFEVCVDDSEWVLIDAETREPVSTEPGGPRIWTVTARFVEDSESGPEGWALIQREIDGSRPC